MYDQLVDNDTTITIAYLTVQSMVFLLMQETH